MSTTHSDELKIDHATDTRARLLEHGDAAVRILAAADVELITIEGVTVSALGDGALEDWQFRVTGLQQAIVSGTAAKVQLLDTNLAMVVEIAAADLDPIVIIEEDNVDFNLVYSPI